MSTAPRRPAPVSPPATPRAPMRMVLRMTIPDPRHPSYRDLHLGCGHVLVGRRIPFDPVHGRYRQITRCRCHLCLSEGRAATAAAERPSQRFMRVTVEPCGKDRASGE